MKHLAQGRAHHKHCLSKCRDLGILREFKLGNAEAVSASWKALPYLGL